MAPPQGGGGAGNRDQEARLRAPAHRQGERNWSTPSGRDGVAPAATGLAGSAARTRRYGKATSNAAANSGDRQPVARPAYARDRSRMGETRMWLGGAAARARSCAQCTRRLSLMPLGSEDRKSTRLNSSH